jgi:hypothetical protein
MSKVQNAGELLERYLQAVRFWLPKPQQADISAELAEDLHSQIEEKEAELGRGLNEDEMAAILQRCGSPIVVASRYRPQTQLIGPVLFPISEFVLKVTFLWVLIPLFVVVVGPAVILPAANRLAAFLQISSTLLTVMFVSAAAITVVFAVLERTASKCNLLDKWDVRSLPAVPKPAQQPSRTHSIFELIFGVIGFAWLLLVPHYPFLVLGPAANFIGPGSLWHTYYLPMVLLSFAGIAHQCVSLARPQWTWLPPTARLVITVLSLALVQSMLRAAGQGTGPDWHPFVAPTAAFTGAAGEAVKVVAVINVIAVVSLLCTWFGLGIAAVKQTWDVLRHFRKQAASSRDIALLRCLF